jgi:hypothetical protein
MQGNVNNAPSSPVKSLLGGMAIYVLIVVLLVAIVLLPPISAVDRVLSVGYTTIPAEEGGFVTAEDGAQLMLFPEGTQNDTKIRFTAIPRSRFLEGSVDNDRLKAAENIPLWLIMKSPYYEIRFRGRKAPTQAIIRIPMPADAEPTRTLDLYSWSGQSWRWVPHFIPPGDDFIETELDYLPSSIVVMQTKPLQPAVSVDLPESTDLPQQALDTPFEINPEGLYLDAEGGIRGDAGALLRPDQTASNLVMPILRNWEDTGTVRSDLVDNMLADGATRQQHIQHIVGTVVGSGYPGIDLDYRGIHPDLRGEYTDFITGLADALHEQGRQLSVRLELPVQIAADRWDTGAYDWRAIGAQADSVKMAVPKDPNAYVPGGQMDAMLRWAVGEVNRHKLSLLVSTRSIEQTGENQKAVPFSEALAPYSQIKVEAGSTLVEPEGQVTFILAGPGQSTGIQFDANSGMYWFAYVGADGQEHTLWLENGASVARKLGYVAEYNLRGLAVQNLIGEENDSQIWTVISQFLNLVIPPVEDRLSVAWQVSNVSGEVVAQANSQLSDPRFTWTAPAGGGEYVISAAISSDGGATAAARGSLQVAVNAP